MLHYPDRRFLLRHVQRSVSLRWVPPDRDASLRLRAWSYGRPQLHVSGRNPLGHGHRPTPSVDRRRKAPDYGRELSGDRPREVHVPGLREDQTVACTVSCHAARMGRVEPAGDDPVREARQRLVRPLVALGRKSWLFAGSEHGGDRAAFLYFLIVTSKLNDIDPQAWPADVLGRLPDRMCSGMQFWVWRIFGAAKSSRRYISAIFSGGCPWHLDWIDGRSCPEG